MLLPDTLEEVAARGLLEGIETLHLDRGYDTSAVRRHVAEIGIENLECAKQRRTPAKGVKAPVPLGRRWLVERTNSWLSNYGQLRRNTDRRSVHRRSQLAFVIGILLVAKLIDQDRRARA